MKPSIMTNAIVLAKDLEERDDFLNLQKKYLRLVNYIWKWFFRSPSPLLQIFVAQEIDYLANKF
jgi:hypothetical protein